MFSTSASFIEQVLAKFDLNVELTMPEQVRHLVNDSRQIKQGDIFCAVNGTEKQGAEFIKPALANNCGLILVETTNENQHGEIEHSKNSLNENVIVIHFYQLNSRLFDLAKTFYQKPQNQLFMVGITGTNGKTSTSQMTAKLLEQISQASAVIGTNGAGNINQLTAIANTTPGATELHQWLQQFSETAQKNVVMEVSSHALEQGRVTSELFNVAVFTNLSRDHLDYHQTMENYAQAKFKLFTQNDAQIAIVNGDDEIAQQWLKNWPKNSPLTVFGRSEQVKSYPSFVYADNIEHSSQGVTFDLITADDEISINSPLIGDFNIDNLLAAISVLLAKGIAIAEIQQAVKHLVPVSGRMEAFKSPNKPLAIVDYAHTPDALESALLASKQHCQGQLWVVFGCGGNRDKGKRAQMGEIAERLSEQIVITNDNPRNEQPQAIADDILMGCKNKEKITVMLERQKAVLHALTNAKQQDVVLLAGKGHEDYIEMNSQRFNYNERELVSSYYANGTAQ